MECYRRIDQNVPREALKYSHACVGVRIFSVARRAAQRCSHSAVKQRNNAVGENAAQVEDPGRFWPLVVLRHRPGRTTTEPAPRLAR